MSNLFESISTRSELPLEIAQVELYHDNCASSSKTSATDVSSRDETSHDSVDDKHPVKRDLLSFMSQKAAGTSSVEEKVSSAYNSAVRRQLGDAEEPNPDLADTQCEKLDNGCKSADICGKDVIHFLVEEYGSAYESQLDVSAIMTTTLASRTESFQSRTVFDDSDLAKGRAAAIQTDQNRLDSDKTILRSFSGSSAIDPQLIDSGDLCTDDSESNSDAFNIISAVKSFTSAIDREPEEGLSMSKKPKTTFRPSKIEFSVSQSASTYHKWKSSVSVPDELVRKLPKPAVQPRLPPELAQSHSGPHVLKSSLNIDFKKQATTKAELRFNSLAAEKQDCPPLLDNPNDESNSEKPPVKLVIKTLSRESKPQRVVIISCSSSVRRESTNRPNDDSDSDSSGRKFSSYGATQATHCVSVPIPQESANNNSGSNQTNQSGTEKKHSLCFCSMQPVVKLSQIDSIRTSSNVLPFRSSAPATWNSLQGLFNRFCVAQQSSGQSQVAVATDAQSDPDKKARPMRDAPSELKRLSDSSGFCTFTNIPDKRESTKIAALYQSAILAPKKCRSKSDYLQSGNSTKHRKSLPQKTKPIVNKATIVKAMKFIPSGMALSGLAQPSDNNNKKIKAVRRQIRMKRRSKVRHFRSARSLQLHQPQLVSTEHTENSPGKPKLLDPLVAASFSRGTEEPTVDHLGRSSLHVAMGSVDEATLQFVINVYKGNDDLDCKDNEGLTPLMLACRNNNTKAASLLLTAGASNSITFPGTGNTSLHEAVLQSNLPLVKLLLDFGADLTTKNAQGRRAIDLSICIDISEFLQRSLDSFTLQIPSKVRIIHSERKLPTVYVLSFPDHPMKTTPCVIKSELCNSLGVSPEYFDVHYSEKMKSYVLENSVILSRIINPHLKESFELSISTRSSISTTLVEIDDEFSSMFHEYVIGEERLTHSTQQFYHSPPSQLRQQDSSSDTEEMTDDNLSDQDECEIRRDDVKEIHRSLKKLTSLEQVRRFNSGQSSACQSTCTIRTVESTQHGLHCQESEASPITFSHSCLVPESGSTAASPKSSGISSLSLESRTVIIKTEPIHIPISQSEELCVKEPEQQNPKSCVAAVRFATPRSGYQLNSYSKKFTEVSREQSSLSKASDCQSDTSEEGDLSFADANLDVDEATMNSVLTARTASSRRKTNPLSCLHTEKSSRLLVSKSKSAPLSVNEARSAAHFFKGTRTATLSVSEARPSSFYVPASRSASDSQSSSAEPDNSPSLFRVNVLPRMPSSTKPFKKTLQSVFASERCIRDSKILRPSAMVRVLKPAMTCQQIRKPDIQGLRVSLAASTSVASTSRSHVTVLQSADQGASQGNLNEQGSRLFVRGQFRPVRVVVSPSNKPTPQSDAAPLFDSPPSFSVVRSLGQTAESG